MSVALRAAEVGELCMQLVASLGPATYWAFLVNDGEGPTTLAQVYEEVRGLDETVDVERYTGDVATLPAWITAAKAHVLLIDATEFGSEDWASLDLMRSSLAHEGAVVFIVVHEGLSDLMQVAPNLASWLGGNAFTKDDGTLAIEGARKHRLATLQSSLKMSNADVVRAAEEGSLPRDPEFAEWLVLLGRGELL